MKSMNLGRTPGIDGIPIEFYILAWDIIKLEFTEVIKGFLASHTISKSQSTGIISMVHKGEEKHSLKN